MIKFNLGVFGGYLVSTFVSVIDSIADYYACAKTINAPPPPVHAMNRGIMIEGFSTLVAGLYGAGHATSTYGVCIGVVGITKVTPFAKFTIFHLPMLHTLLQKTIFYGTLNLHTFKYLYLSSNICT